jgi:serine/tyrosine/threonine adenylyltransferase
MTIIPFDNSYARLPPQFHARLNPTPVAAPRLLILNKALVAELGLDEAWLRSSDGVNMLSGNVSPVGSEPLAAAYAGHQFGHFSPQLGDGRAILLGEVMDRHGQRRDIQLKGSGPTPFSRRGDGRAALGPALREYLISEAMHALGIPTTRALAVVSTGEPVYRQTPLPGAVVTRIASSHIRVGTFQFFAARGDLESVRLLADHAIARHYPAALNATRPMLAFLQHVVAAQAKLVAQWLTVGFVHGVMNTDNMSVAGETIDYGPCAFMDVYDPAAVFSSIDEMGRYAYGNQPKIAQWNLARFAETLVPLLAADETEGLALANEAIAVFPALFETEVTAGYRRKLGLASAEEGDLRLAQDLLKCMALGKADHTLVFRRLAASAEDEAMDGGVRSLFTEPAGFDDWAAAWRERLARDSATPSQRSAAMRQANPAVIPRNHLVEAALQAASERGDLAPFMQLHAELARPFDGVLPGSPHAAPPPEAGPYVTFCGT